METPVRETKLRPTCILDFNFALVFVFLFVEYETKLRMQNFIQLGKFRASINFLNVRIIAIHFIIFIIFGNFQHKFMLFNDFFFFQCFFSFFLFVIEILLI